MRIKKSMNCIFCAFGKGTQKTHANGFPFETLLTLKNTISFLSTDLPATEDGHVLVIPKKHFENMEDIPKNSLHELIDHVSLLTRVLRKTHSGCNILLNDGKSAGQRVFHTHFHVIPREKNDKIIIEKFKRKNLTKKEFITLHKVIKQEIDSL